MDIGVLSPGQMGSGISHRLLSRGARVVTCVEGRSERTRMLARQAGVEQAPDLETLVDSVDLVISVIAPAQAEKLARDVAGAVRSTGRRIVFAECNAIAPDTVRGIARELTDAGAGVVDGSIIGPPPTESRATRIYVSGPSTDALERLNDFGLDVRPVGAAIGSASALKMSYAAVTKGTVALATQLLVTAQRNDVYEVLIEELSDSVPQLLALMRRRLPVMPVKAHRWVGEMEEIAQTFADAGLPGGTFEGIADLYRWVGEHPLADETPETRDADRGMDAVIELLADPEKAARALLGEGRDSAPEGGDPLGEGRDSAPEGGDPLGEERDSAPEGGDPLGEERDSAPEGGDSIEG
ncbi:MAG: DUF1932 domain-containing protein [Nitriliruptorales bacterium]|nr:DUF1932 domain-containing protein [Nitriliruptorales bacterium]